MLNAVPLAARDADEAVKVMESRFVIAQLLTSTGETESAIAELRAVRPQVRDFAKGKQARLLVLIADERRIGA